MKKLLLLLCLSLPAFGQIINPSDTTSGNASGAFSTINISGISYLVGGARVGAGNVMASDYPVGTWVFWDPTNLNWLIVPTGGAKEVFIVAALEASGTHATCAGGVHCGWFAAVGSQVAAIFDAGNCTKDHWVGNSTTTAGASKDLTTAATSAAVTGTVAHVIQATGTTPCTVVVDNVIPTPSPTAGSGGTWVTTRCASGCTGGADTLTTPTAGTAFATTDTHITNALLASGNWVHILAAGTSTTTGSGASSESYQISIFDGTNTLTMTQAAVSTHATTLSGLPWKAEGYIFCAGSSQVSVQGAIFSPTNATASSSSILSQNDQGIRTLDCTKALTISIKANTTMTNSATTTIASLEVDWH